MRSTSIFLGRAVAYMFNEIEYAPDVLSAVSIHGEIPQLRLDVSNHSSREW